MLKSLVTRGIVFVILCAGVLSAKTIYIPSDAATVAEAVAMSEPGDIISGFPKPGLRAKAAQAMAVVNSTINISNTTDRTIEGMHVLNPEGAGMYANYTTNAKFINCIIEGVTDDAFSLQGAKNFLIDNCEVRKFRPSTYHKDVFELDFMAYGTIQYTKVIDWAGDCFMFGISDAGKVGRIVVGPGNIFDFPKIYRNDHDYEHEHDKGKSI